LLKHLFCKTRWPKKQTSGIVIPIRNHEVSLLVPLAYRIFLTE
jgi:hypothetical protein